MLCEIYTCTEILAFRHTPPPLVIQTKEFRPSFLRQKVASFAAVRLSHVAASPGAVIKMTESRTFIVSSREPIRSVI